jgi:hypothetical protein
MRLLYKDSAWRRHWDVAGTILLVIVGSSILFLLILDCAKKHILFWQH